MEHALHQCCDPGPDLFIFATLQQSVSFEQPSPTKSLETAPSTTTWTRSEEHPVFILSRTVHDNHVPTDSCDLLLTEVTVEPSCTWCLCSSASRSAIWPACASCGSTSAVSPLARQRSAASTSLLARTARNSTSSGREESDLRQHSHCEISCRPSIVDERRNALHEVSEIAGSMLKCFLESTLYLLFSSSPAKPDL